MLSTVLSAAILGIDAYPVHVEVDTDRTLPTFTVVGLPDTTVRESKECGLQTSPCSANSRSTVACVLCTVCCR